MFALPPEVTGVLNSGVRPYLASARGTYHGYLELSTFFVGLGVVLEAFEVIRDLRHGVSEYRAHRGEMVAPEPELVRFPWVSIISVVGWLMVSAGVVGEYYFDGKVNGFDVTLQRIDSESLAGATVDAGNADERAAVANRQAREAEKATEDERLARVQLAAKVSWIIPDRGLIPRLAPALRVFIAQRFTIVSDLGDPERAGVFSWTMQLLGAGGWRFEVAASTSELTFQASNIVLWISPDAPNGVVDAAHALAALLNRAGFPSVVLQSSWGPTPAPPELIRVVIFRKGPRMTVTGNMITFEGIPSRLYFGNGPPPGVTASPATDTRP